MPHQGVDTLVAASHLVLALQTVVARNVHPCESAVVSVTQIHGGEAWNVVPDDAVLRGTIRSFKPAVQDLVERSIERICAGIGETYGAQISVEFDIADAVTEEAVARFVPDLIVAPFLKRAIPASIWSRHVCMIVHPGIAGDRGPSSLDWAIQSGLPEWGDAV